MGESMFRLDERISIDASKVCLVHLVRWLQHRGFLLLDTQFYTDHLGQFGCVEIPRTQYLGQLADAIGRDVPWGEFSAADEDS